MATLANLLPVLKAAEVISEAFGVNEDAAAIDEAFIWEPPLDRRPLITFGDLRQLRRALQALREE